MNEKGTLFWIQLGPARLCKFNSCTFAPPQRHTCQSCRSINSSDPLSTPCDMYDPALGSMARYLRICYAHRSSSQHTASETHRRATTQIDNVKKFELRFTAACTPKYVARHNSLGQAEAHEAPKTPSRCRLKTSQGYSSLKSRTAQPLVEGYGQPKRAIGTADGEHSMHDIHPQHDRSNVSHTLAKCKYKHTRHMYT